MDIERVKITVLRKLDSGDIREDYGGNVGECPESKAGDEFIVDGLAMPQGFCSWAWADTGRKKILKFAEQYFSWAVLYDR